MGDFESYERLDRALCDRANASFCAAARAWDSSEPPEEHEFRCEHYWGGCELMDCGRCKYYDEERFGGLDCGTCREDDNYEDECPVFLKNAGYNYDKRELAEFYEHAGYEGEED